MNILFALIFLVLLIIIIFGVAVHEIITYELTQLRARCDLLEFEVGILRADAEDGLEDSTANDTS